MRTPKKESERDGQQAGIDPDVDRFPDLESVLSLIRDHEDVGDGPLERLEVFCFRSNEATFRLWTKGAEEPIVGHQSFS